MLTFPTVSKTWCYDTSIGIWHERASFENGEFYRHRSNCQAFFNNLTMVGDFENGNIYSMTSSVYDDNGNTQKWVRSWRALPTGVNDLKRSVQHSLQVDMETGIGLPEGQGSDPEVVLRFSDDGGYTYQQDGHSFYMLTFPTVSKTWCYDTSIGIWHERASFENGVS